MDQAQKVLIVDDTEINLILFAALIKKLDNCVATTFSNATQGLQWAAAQVPDLVIVDYNFQDPFGNYLL